MNRFAKLTTLIAAGATSALLTGNVSFASVADYTQLEQSVKDGLKTLQVSSDHIDMLTMAQVAQLSSILDGSTKTVDKQAAATFLIDSALHPTMLVKDNAGAMQMVAQLKNDLTASGLKYPPVETMSVVQVQQLIAVYNGTDGVHVKTAKAEALLRNLNTPVVATMGNAGAMQLATELKTDLERVGLKLPAPDKLTYAQVASLTAIFDQKGTEADMKAAAMQVLGES